MKLTTDLLLSVMPTAQARVERFALHLAAGCIQFGIDTPARIAAFLATIAHESGELKYTREIASGEAYEGRKGLGNTQPGDGPRYKGRGLIQVTGRYNYTQLSQATGTDYVAQPELLERDQDAALASCWWWKAHGCNELADTGSIETVTRRVNGGLNGIDSRRMYFDRAQKAIANQAAEPATPTPSPIRVSPNTSPWPAPLPDSEVDHALLDAMVSNRQPEPAPAPPPNPSPWMTADGSPMYLLKKKPEDQPVIPFIAAALPAILDAVPDLIKIFGSKEAAVSERNTEAAMRVFDIAKEAIGATNAQEVAERVQAEPEAAQAVREAVKSQWFELQQSTPESIEAASKRNEVYLAPGATPGYKTPAMQIALVVLALVFMVLIDMLFVNPGNYSPDMRAFIMGAIIGAGFGAVVNFYLGSSDGSKRAGDAVRNIAMQQDRPR